MLRGSTDVAVGAGMVTVGTMARAGAGGVGGGAAVAVCHICCISNPTGAHISGFPCIRTIIATTMPSPGCGCSSP